MAPKARPATQLLYNNSGSQFLAIVTMDTPLRITKRRSLQQSRRSASPDSRPLKRSSSLYKVTPPRSASAEKRALSYHHNRRRQLTSSPLTVSPLTPSSSEDECSSPDSYTYFDSPVHPAYSPESPTSPPKFKPMLSRSSVCRNLLRDLMEQSAPATPAIFAIPEILNIILKYVGYDDDQRIPKEPSVARRPPVSYKHAVLIHGPQEGAKIWRRSISNSSISSNVNQAHRTACTSNLYNCMMVNRLWYQITKEILNENVFFESDKQLSKFTIDSSIRCKTFVLHKLRTTPQYVIDRLSTRINPVNLEWIEFYICPQLTPPPTLFTPALVKLSVPGCRSICDDQLVAIVRQAPNLRTLDLRACELITDASLYQVAQHCPLLETLNVGRHLRGDLVSDYSICPVIRSCQIKTIGLAGCNISNRTIWELAIARPLLERLSINHCPRLDNNGICKALRRDMFQQLSVLEIRGLHLTDLRALAQFKKRQLHRNITVLIETCELLEQKLKETELQMDLEISNRIFSDIVDWLDEEDDDDRNYVEFRRQRHLDIID